MIICTRLRKNKKNKKKTSDDKTKQQTSKKPTKDDLIALNKQIIDEEIDLNEELFNKYFKIQRPSDMLMYLNKTNDEKKIN